jgi:hypothetical protein
MKYVTITLRNTGWWNERSSDIHQWTMTAQAIERAGYKVIVIPDGTKPDEGLPGFESDKIAAENVLRRAELYKGAAMNLGVSGGPMWLCWFLGCPAIICKLVNENEPTAGAAVWRSIGVPPGTQPPHARPKQRLLWGSDMSTSVLTEFFNVMDGSVYATAHR